MATTQPTVTPTSAPPAAGLHPAAPATLGLALRHDPALAAYPQPSDVILSCPKEPASALHSRDPAALQAYARACDPAAIPARDARPLSKWPLLNHTSSSPKEIHASTRTSTVRASFLFSARALLQAPPSTDWADDSVVLGACLGVDPGTFAGLPDVEQRTRLLTGLYCLALLSRLPPDVVPGFVPLNSVPGNDPQAAGSPATHAAAAAAAADPAAVTTTAHGETTLGDPTPLANPTAGAIEAAVAAAVASHAAAAAETTRKQTQELLEQFSKRFTDMLHDANRQPGQPPAPAPEQPAATTSPEGHTAKRQRITAPPPATDTAHQGVSVPATLLDAIAKFVSCDLNAVYSARQGAAPNLHLAPSPGGLSLVPVQRPARQIPSLDELLDTLCFVVAAWRPKWPCFAADIQTQFIPTVTGIARAQGWLFAARYAQRHLDLFFTAMSHGHRIDFRRSDRLVVDLLAESWRRAPQTPNQPGNPRRPQGAGRDRPTDPPPGQPAACRNALAGRPCARWPCPFYHPPGTKPARRQDGPPRAEQPGRQPGAPPPLPPAPAPASSANPAPRG